MVPPSPAAASWWVCPGIELPPYAGKARSRAQAPPAAKKELVAPVWKGHEVRAYSLRPYVQLPTFDTELPPIPVPAATVALAVAKGSALLDSRWFLVSLRNNPVKRACHGAVVPERLLLRIFGAIATLVDVGFPLGGNPPAYIPQQLSSWQVHCTCTTSHIRR